MGKRHDSRRRLLDVRNVPKLGRQRLQLCLFPMDDHKCNVLYEMKTFQDIDVKF